MNTNRDALNHGGTRCWAPRRTVSVVLLLALVSVVIVCAGAAGTAFAGEPATYTVDTFQRWLKQYAAAKPDFKAGDVLTAKDLERMRPFVPPGYLEQLNFPNFKAQIIDVIPHTPASSYLRCTEQYASQVRLRNDGAIMNYTCGQPFPNETLSTSDPMAGFKAAWNYTYRYLYFGFYDLSVDTGLIRLGYRIGSGATNVVGAAAPPGHYVADLPAWKTAFPTEADVRRDYGGAEYLERYLTLFYARIPFTHLADLDGKAVPLAGADKIEQKNLTYFSTPFDIRGTAFIIWRYLEDADKGDPYRADDSWAYIPNLRRVRRISAEVKSDSLLGTDITIDDFDGFNDRVLNWDWKFLGWKDVMEVNDPGNHYVRYLGPNNVVPDDQWSVKKMAVTLRTPKSSRHPYSAVINLWAADAWSPGYQLTFDRKGKLWKVLEWQYKYSESFVPGFWAETMNGAHAVIWWHVSAIDVQNNRATVFRQQGPVMERYSPQLLKALFDAGALESIHR
jgi:hypothetical protein